jgi:hypothetical protein
MSKSELRNQGTWDYMIDNHVNPLKDAEIIECSELLPGYEETPPTIHRIAGNNTHQLTPEQWRVLAEKLCRR